MVSVSSLSDLAVILPENSHLSRGTHKRDEVTKTIKDQSNCKGKIRSHRNESDEGKISSLRPHIFKGDNLKLNRYKEARCSKPVILNGESQGINHNKKWDADVNVKKVILHMYLFIFFSILPCE